MSYVDGIDGCTGNSSIKYPVNNLYKNGAVKNDDLTKIITQKFIAKLHGCHWKPGIITEGLVCLFLKLEVVGRSDTNITSS